MRKALKAELTGPKGGHMLQDRPESSNEVKANRITLVMPSL